MELQRFAFLGELDGLLDHAVVGLKFRGFGPVWQFLVIIALSAQTSLINFTAEARPYMPLAAAAVGTLAYYLAPAAMRSRAWVAVGGWVAVMLGASMHPYFGLYWLAVFAFAHGLALSEGTLKPGLKTLLRHVNLPLSLAGTAVFLSVGSFTWLRGGPSFKFDPFFWLPREQLINNVVFLHLEFFGRHALRREAWLGFVAALPVLGLLLPRRLKLHLQSLIAPAVLLLLAIGLTAVLCYLSYRRDYWILSRQWVGSIAMATVASIWLWGELARAFARWRSWAGALVVLLLPCLIAAPTLIACREKWQSYRQNLATQSALPLLEEPKLDAPFTERSAEAWVQMANQNIHQGGPVWPYFQHYYAQESVINPVFAEPDKEKRQ